MPVFPVWTEQDYLEFEDSSNVRHEFYGGMVVALAGGWTVPGCIA
jgi:hypothetical protein